MNRSLVSRSSRRNAYALIIFISLAFFEFFSYASSYAGLFGMMGISSWAMLLSLSFVLIDFAGAAKLFSGAPPDDSDRYLAGAWALSAAGDSFLTFFAVQASIAQSGNHLLVDAGTVAESFLMVWVPVIVAVMTWGVQFFLVRSMNSIIDEWMQEGRTVKRR